MDIRITYSSEKELNSIVELLKKNYSEVIVNPKKYENSRYGKTGEYRAYIKVKV